MSLKPPGKHLDGGELPDVGDVMFKVSKLLATEGEHHSYYLNEHRAFELFAKTHDFKFSRLLSVKGSRQNLSVQQATRVLRNVKPYLEYLHENRVESDINELVDGVWNGLRDRYVLGGLRARSFVDAAFTTPLIFFTHSDVVSPNLATSKSSLFTNSLHVFPSQIARDMLGRVMDGARAWIAEVSTLDAIGFKKPPDLQFMAKAILAKLADEPAVHEV